MLPNCDISGAGSHPRYWAHGRATELLGALSMCNLAAGLTLLTRSPAQFVDGRLHSAALTGSGPLRNAAFTRSGVNGTRRSRTPVASNTALPMAAGSGPTAISAAPDGGSSGRLIRTISTDLGTPSIVTTG